MLTTKLGEENVPTSIHFQLSCRCTHKPTSLITPSQQEPHIYLLISQAEHMDIAAMKMSGEGIGTFQPQPCPHLSYWIDPSTMLPHKGNWMKPNATLI